MKYNTLTRYDMRAKYREWKVQVRQGEEFKDYNHDDPSLDLPCRIVVNGVGSLTLFCDRQLQAHALVYDLLDASGVPFMQEMYYAVRESRPVFDPMGNINGYLHPLVTMSSVIADTPLSPRPDYGFDQG